MNHLVVLVAGVGRSAGVWDEQVRRAAPHRTLAVTVSELVDGEFGLDAAVAGLRERIAADDASVVTVAGLGLGGMVATRYAATHPEAVDGLLLSGSEVRPNAPLLWTRHTLLRLVPARLLRLPAGQDRRTYLSLLAGTARADVSDDLARIRVPATVLCGARDRPRLPAARALARGLLYPELRVVPGVGHHVATEAPAEFARALRDLLVRAGHD